MPATEQTWRDSKLMHVVFGVSSLVMLIGTMWMLAADHQREWKQYQRNFREVETGTAQARIAQQNNADYKHDVDEREWDLVEAREDLVPPEKVDQFAHLVEEARATKPPLAAQAGEGGGDLVQMQNYYKAWKAAEPNRPPRGDKSEPAEAARRKILSERDHFFEEANKFIGDARFREANTLTLKKFKAADFDVARSQYELAVGNNAADDELNRLQKNVDAVHDNLDKLALRVQDSTAYRKGLESIVGDMTAEETKARKALDEQRLKLDRLEKALYEREDNFGKELLSLPIIDCFGHPLAPNQIWLPKLTINNNFRDVARFDRCTTCHQAIDRTAPGSAVEPGYRKQHRVTVSLPVPSEAADAKADKELGSEDAVRKLYGLQLARRGWLHDNDVTISVVRPESPAAIAGLMVGDVLSLIGGGPVVDRTAAINFLHSSALGGKPQSIEVLRGLPNPYVSHPRLDLFVGSLSPHTAQNVGCTVCHEGQGSATAFKWASHTPNDPTQAEKWMHDYGWFNNHHWIFPMTPKRFSESMCLKCHHEVVELEPSDRFPDPPAPTLMAGYHTIRQYGCFGCHEINGYDGPNRRIGPDLRAEPNYSAAAQALLASGKLDDRQKSLAEKLADHPENDTARHTLLESLRNPPGGQETATKPPAATDVTLKKLTDLLEDVETPGKLRKVGPGLRHVASKLNYDFLYSWVRKPSDFRPSTKMPQFFGLTEHLEGFGLKQSEEFEPIEIRATVEYLLAKSQPFTFADQATGITEEASGERGKKLFETRGCLACHQHADFPAGKMTQGPDLSRIGAKLKAAGNKDGGKWLYSWLKNPSAYHPRTLMPNLILEPIRGADKKVTDPAADLATYLLASDGDWKPANVPSRQLSDQDRAALENLAMEHLKAATSVSLAKKYLKDGIPESRASEFKGDEVELVGPMTEQKKLLYVGRRTISKYGCSGCHDVPGYEDVKPIGTGLADWGRKGADKLAFEQIDEFMVKHLHGAQHSPGAEHAEASEHAEINYMDMPPDQGYFLEKLMHHEREGFIWNKLRQPRSYDYRKTENKGYNERLRMPKFNFTEDQVQEVITFVLGLVAEPPAVQYVYKASPQRGAIIEGEKLVEKYNCTGCHTLKMDQWNLAYHASDFSDPPPFPDYPFLEPHATPQQIQASEAIDARGLMHATVTGMPAINADTGEVLLVDEDGAPIEAGDSTTPAFYQFTPWQSVLINGKFRQAGLQNLMVPKRDVVQQYPAHGGYLPRLIYAAVFKDEKAVNPNAKADEAWGWLPPPLMGEGRKVQSAWLHDFLLDPYPIRPAVVLRMPKFNMSSAEAGTLARYFAAVDGIDTPFNTELRGEGQLSQDQTKQFQDALKIVTDNNYCIKCHLVGDFAPAGSDRAKGPHLDQVYTRLRLSYLRDWIANPKRILPYTGMPVNIPYDKPVSQALFPGSSEQQLHGLVELLGEYDRYTESQTPIKKLIKTDAAPPADTTRKSAQN